MKTWHVVVLMVLALVIGALALWVYQSRKQLAAVAKNRQALGGTVGLISDVGSVVDDAKGIWSSLHL